MASEIVEKIIADLEVKKEQLQRRLNDCENMLVSFQQAKINFEADLAELQEQIDELRLS